MFFIKISNEIIVNKIKRVTLESRLIRDPILPKKKYSIEKFISN